MISCTVPKSVSFATPRGARRIGPSSVAKVYLKAADGLWLLVGGIDAPDVAKLGLETGRRFFILAERLVQAVDQRVRIGAGEDHRRLDLDHVVEGAVGREQHAKILHAIDQGRGFRGGRRLRGSGAHQFEAEEETEAANVTDDGVARGEFAQTGPQVIAGRERVLLQLFVANDIKDRQSHGAGNGAAAEGVEVLKIGKSSS